MTRLSPCGSCHGLLPKFALQCPHCDTPVPLASRIVKSIAMLATGSTLAVTLMACYGAPPCSEDDDQDGDGFYAGYCYSPKESREDCNDENASIKPCAPDDLGDGVDQNCDGVDGTDTSSSAIDNNCT